MENSPDLSVEIERLKNENNALNAQLKEMLRAESELYTLQEKLDKQRKIYYALGKMMHTLDSFRNINDIAVAVADFITNILTYGKCTILSVEHPGSNLCVLKPIALAGYYEKTEQEELQNLTFTMSRQELEKTDQHPVKNSPGRQDVICNCLHVDEYAAAGLKNSRDIIHVLVVAGNSTERKEYYAQIKEDDEIFIAFKSVVNHTATVLNNIESYQTIEHEQKLLARANEELKRLDQVKMDFFSNISHEIRTPLTLSLGPVEELLKQDYFPEQDYHYLRTIQSNQLRLLKLINELLDFSRLESGMIQSRFAKQDIIKLLKLYVGIVESAAQSKSIAIQTEFPARSLYLYIDENKFEKIIMNLLANAYKFTNKGGSISLSVKVGQGQAFIAVSDTGIGIPETEYERIFDRFSQVDTSETRAYSGTGIGLALVKEFVKIHQGTITVQSQVGQGSTFTVALPVGKKHLNPGLIAAGKKENSVVVAEYEKVQFYEDPIPAHSNPGSIKESSRKCVLVVDDNPEMRQYLATLLSAVYTVVEKANGQDALDYIQQNLPDLIISDVMMPGMSGYDLCGKIKTTKGEIGRIPVILITARAELSMKIKGLEYGADDYLSKPFNSRELLSRASNLIKIRSQEQKLSQALEKLQTTHNRLEESYKKLHLTRSEFAAISRRVGRSEIASDIIHNWGNKLNSISITVEMLNNLLQSRQNLDLSKVSALLENEDSLKIEEKRGNLIVYIKELNKAIKNRNVKVLEKLYSLADYIDDMKTFLRHMEKNINIIKLEETCSINEIVEEALALVEFEEDSQSIQIIRNFSDLAPVVLDKYKLVQVLFELLLNARNACKLSHRQQNYIKITTGRSENNIVIEIEDDGIGIATEKIHRIFMMDERTKNMGLHMSANFVDILKGKIECESAGPGEGAVFRVKLFN